MDKKELRREMKRRNRAMTPGERAAAAGRIFRRVGELPAFGAARCVAMFCSLPDEPPTGGALAQWSREKRIVVPRVAGEEMEFFDYDPATLVAGAFGIAEPGAEAVPCDASEIDLIVVPGVAFTAAGERMGRGRGYYDRYLSQPGMHAVKVGVCFAHQLVGELPVEPHDVRMDAVCAG